MKIKSQNLKFLLLVAAILLVGVGIAYAALSTTLNITFGTVTQSALSWNVAFDETFGATATASGTSATGRSCGTATVTATTVTVADTELSKPGDKCTYALKVKNTGTIDATLKTITPTAPQAVTCETASGADLECGNISYKLTTDNGGASLLTTGGTLAKSGEQLMYLVVSYKPEDAVQSTAIVQSGAKFTLTYEQV